MEDTKTCACDVQHQDVDLEQQARSDREAERKACDTCMPMECEPAPRSAIDRIVGELGYACEGALGEILRAITRKAEDEHRMLQQDLHYWRERYFEERARADRLLTQRNHLLDVIDNLRDPKEPSE